VIVNNVAPIVYLQEPWEGAYEGIPLMLTGYTYDLVEQDTLTATVDYGDGTGVQPVELFGNFIELPHVYATRGLYTVTLTVTDDDGGVGIATLQLYVANAPPEVSVISGEGEEGSLFVTSGSFTDQSTGPWTARVDYGDGTGWHPLALNGQSFQLEHVYADNGWYVVTVAVRDNEGTEGYGYAYVDIFDVPPVVTLSGGTGNEGSAISISGTLTDPGRETGSWGWLHYGDGWSSWTYLPKGSFTLNHVYAENGTYTVTFSTWPLVTASAQVVVHNVAPAVSATAGTGDEGSWIALSASSSDPGSRDTVAAAHVDYGDGSPVETITPRPGQRSFAMSHRYADSGTYQVTISVVDDDGGVGTATVAVQVQNVAPTATASNDSPRYWGVPVNLVGTATDPSEADVQAGFTALWTLGDGLTASGLTTAYAYAAPGTYSAQLSVTDKDGGTNIVPATTTVTIQKRPGAVTCQDVTATFGFPAALSARFVDGLAGGLPGGRSLSFRLGGSTGLGSATTDASGLAGVQSPGELMPGSYSFTVSFAEDSHYTAAEASCTLTVTQSAQGQITGGGLRSANNSRGGFNVMRAEGGPLQGELQFQNGSTSFHAHELTALGLSADMRKGWFAGVGRDGRAFTAYVEDNGEPGTTDVFKLWIDGVLQTGDGDGTISGGNIQIHDHRS
jgi:PKD repeat protein